MENIEFSYKLSAENVLETMKSVKKDEGKGVKIYIYSAIFIALAIMWAVYFFSDGGALNLFLSLFCISMIILLWFLPYKNQKQIAKLTEEADETFYMSFSQDGVFFDKEKTDFLSYENIRFLESENVISVLAEGDKIFCAPKEHIKEIDLLREFLNKQNYKDLRCLVENK